MSKPRSCTVRSLPSNIDDSLGIYDDRGSDRLCIGKTGQEKSTRLTESQNVTHQIGSSGEGNLLIEAVFPAYDFGLEDVLDLS